MKKRQTAAQGENSHVRTNLYFPARVIKPKKPRHSQTCALHRSVSQKQGRRRQTPRLPLIRRTTTACSRSCSCSCSGADRSIPEASPSAPVSESVEASGSAWTCAGSDYCQSAERCDAMAVGLSSAVSGSELCTTRPGMG